MLSPATTRSAWITTTKRRPHSSLGKEPIALSGNALRTKKRRSYLPEVGEQDVPETNRDIYGGIYRQHVSKINYDRAPYSSSGRGIPDPEKVQHEVESSKMRFRSFIRKILGLYSQQPRNRGKPRQDKSCARHAATIKHKRSPTPNWKNSCAKVLRSTFVSKANDKCQPFFQVLKKSFPMGCTLRRSIHSVKNLSELSPHSGKSL